jgi:hypothetical protein
VRKRDNPNFYCFSTLARESRAAWSVGGAPKIDYQFFYYSMMDEYFCV